MLEWKSHKCCKRLQSFFILCLSPSCMYPCMHTINFFFITYSFELWLHFTFAFVQLYIGLLMTIQVQSLSIFLDQILHINNTFWHQCNNYWLAPNKTTMIYWTCKTKDHPTSDQMNTYRSHLWKVMPIWKFLSCLIHL